MDFIFPTADQIVQANAIKTPYATSLCKLIKATITLDPLMEAADLAAIEADFTGYTPVTFTTVGAVYPDPAGGVSFDLANAFFQLTAVTTTNDIYGGWIETAGGDLQFAFLFTNAYPMQTLLAAINLGLIVNLFGPRGVVGTVNGVVQ